MPIVQLTKLFLTSVVSQETHGWYTDPARDQTYSVRADIRTYAGGRQRAVGSIGASGSWRFTLVELTLADTQILRDWMEFGVTLFVRDHRGQAMYGTFFEIQISEYRATLYTDPTNLYTAGITLRQVDVTEGV